MYAHNQRVDQLIRKQANREASNRADKQSGKQENDGHAIEKESTDPVPHKHIHE